MGGKRDRGETRESLKCRGSEGGVAQGRGEGGRDAGEVSTGGGGRGAAPEKKSDLVRGSVGGSSARLACMMAQLYRLMKSALRTRVSMPLISAGTSGRRSWAACHPETPPGPFSGVSTVKRARMRSKWARLSLTNKSLAPDCPKRLTQLTVLSKAAQWLRCLPVRWGRAGIIGRATLAAAMAGLNSCAEDARMMREGDEWRGPWARPGERGKWPGV